MKMICGTPKVIRVKLWEINVGKTWHWLCCGQAEALGLQSTKCTGAKSGRGKFAVLFFFVCVKAIWMWPQVGFFKKANFLKSNFGDKWRLRMKMSSQKCRWEDYSCAAKLMLSFKATCNRNPIGEKRGKKVHFLSALSLNSWRFESILQYWIYHCSEDFKVL